MFRLNYRFHFGGDMQITYIDVRFEVLTVVKIEFLVSWVVVPCYLVVGYQHFRGPCCFHGSPELWYTTTTLHGAGSQKTVTSTCVEFSHCFMEKRCACHRSKSSSKKVKLSSVTSTKLIGV
jgi:hypothetical protein